MIARENAPHYIAFMDAARPVMKEVAERRLPLEAALKLLAAAAIAGPAEAAPVERPAKRRDEVNAEMLRQLLELQTRKGRRAAVGILAKKLARDPHDPDEVAALKKHLRRLRLRHEKRALRGLGTPRARRMPRMRSRADAEAHQLTVAKLSQMMGDFQRQRDAVTRELADIFAARAAGQPE